MGEGPRGWEASYAARKAWLDLSPEPTGDLQEENRRIDALCDEYWATREEWSKRTGCQPPSRQEILKQGRVGVPKFVWG
jgi:hypothetical protein